MATYSATDKSVRDHSQTARIHNGQIEVTSKVGGSVVHKYSFSVSDWKCLARHANPDWARHDYISRLTRDLDNGSGGPAQAERIRDSQIRAIEKAFLPGQFA